MRPTTVGHLAWCVREGAVAKTGIPDKTRTVEMTILKSAPYNDSVGEKQKSKVDHQVSRTAGRDHCPEQLKSPRCVNTASITATRDSRLTSSRQTNSPEAPEPTVQAHKSVRSGATGLCSRCTQCVEAKDQGPGKNSFTEVVGDVCENRRRQSHWELRLDQPAPRAARRDARRCPLQLVAVLSHVCSKVKLRSECDDDRTRL